MATRGVEGRPSGLRYREDLVSGGEESSLLDWCRSLATEPVVMHGVESRRRVRHFGVHHDAASWRTAPMRFQRTAAGGERRVYEQLLARRSAYVLRGAARSAWQHSIPAVEEERWSVTFRQLRRGRDAPTSAGVPD